MYKDYITRLKELTKHIEKKYLATFLKNTKVDYTTSNTSNPKKYHSRPEDWVCYYIGLAHAISKKSHDIQTQHGCIITDRKNRILGVGYNDFPRGLEDDKLPNTRPDKYPWMIHAEKNALANCVIRPDNGIAYVTGQCCNDCIMALWQHGITKVIMHHNHGTHLWNEEQKKILDLFLQMSKLEVEYVSPDISWIKEISI